MSRSELCTEAEITTLVYSFYDKVRADPLIGPVFNDAIHDWDTHLTIMVRFWSSVLIGSGTYSGAPMPKHVALPGLDADMFVRWLQLFHDTTETLPNRLFAERAEEAAHRIARSLWFGYQMNNNPDSMPKDLHNG
ncbi:group III truncated hemoglobin [Pusillimonas sp. ANT_WB101]|uniref:group III truncated hemoglobin n=1 Tax=Pusillimonas sp. ANT_WB101 TaxID=2597356 RepID=UPI0011F09197|nr:group III truncated hemoglobin [Pusillimonas sp. ANT_WB101]KAA0890111.1 group III truncated hemoglobin [Pusillimonas sp. ANT_WB101]NYT76350.1 group III truncated hemoglobin [Alcaligenaceae bacterium]